MIAAIFCERPVKRRLTSWAIRCPKTKSTMIAEHEERRESEDAVFENAVARSRPRQRRSDAEDDESGQADQPVDEDR